ncbi:PEP-CTERM sorting domain-containing protein [Glacieibacterium megasporae]|uniref:PEP-CTERM sorting domain-containing protein n=1 Tax=Glacieibacterium megasporae TaxID=2835787 RepID=UPI001CAA5604|nr:PEP-CTERM sorting domain-containing protein [Polymorphobacter megasporae]
MSQGQITNIGSVPEPASWAMMLTGLASSASSAVGAKGCPSSLPSADCIRQLQ